MMTINNDFYEELEEKWYTDWSHPIALLRKENEIRNPWILETIHRILGPKKKILDVGCGGGFLTNTLAQAGHDVVGIDLSVNSLKIASSKDKTNSVCYIHADALNVPFPENSFDVVCVMDLLEHVQHPDRVIAEASRVLKQNGLFFFHTFNRNPLSWLIIIKGVEWWMPSTPRHLHVYELFIKPKELNHWCVQEEIHIRKIQGLTPKFSWRFWMSFIKRKVDERICFQFISSLKTGYVGYGEKIGSINEGV